MQARASSGWQTLRGDARHTGYVDSTLSAPFRLAWARYIEGDRLSTAMEPIVAEGNWQPARCFGVRSPPAEKDGRTQVT